MLLREDERGVLAIGQPSHAWVSGQLARAWGNALFGTVHPWEEICLAAEQHDVGMATWDVEPSFNAESGLPHAFVQMPLAVHIGLWGAAGRRLVRQSRYAALLVSMHGVRLYEMRDLAKQTPDDAAAIRAFFAEQRAFQAGLRASLQADPATAPNATDTLIQRGSDLIWSWDYLSLGLCLGWAPCTAKGVPLAHGSKTEVSLTPILTATADAPVRIAVDPWPFEADSVTVHCEGQRLPASGYANENELRAGLEAAAWETLTIELVALERSA
jgi:hypothetical protein